MPTLDPNNPKHVAFADSVRQYAIENYTFSQAAGWVATVRERPDLLPYSVSVTDLRLVNVTNVSAALQVMPLPAAPNWGDVVEVK